MKHIGTVIIVCFFLSHLHLFAQQADLPDTEKRKRGTGQPEQILNYSKRLSLHSTSASGGRLSWKTGSAPLLDSYICYGDAEDPITFEIKIDQDVKDLKNVTLTLSVWDVDESSGEVDVVSVNGQIIGTLHGANDSWSINNYNINPSILVGGTKTNPGINTIMVDLTVDSWCVTVDWGEISADGSQMKIVEFIPGTNKLASFTTPDLHFKFSKELDDKSVSATTVKLQYRNAAGDLLDVPSTYTVTKDLLAIKPTGGLKDGVKYTITIAGNSDGVKGKQGDTLAGPQKYDFAAMPDLTPDGPAANAPGVYPIQVVRNAKQIREKATVMRIYTNKWTKKADVHPSSQLEKIPVKVTLAEGATQVASQNIEAERLDIRDTAAKKKAGTNSLNFYYHWLAALADGDHQIDVKLEPVDQVGTPPENFTKVTPIKIKGGKTMKVVYQYILADSWAGGVPAADKTRMDRLMANCKIFFRDNFPVKEVEVTSAADVNLAVPLASYTWPHARGFAAATVRDGMPFLDTVKNIMLNLDAWKNKGAGVSFVGLVPQDFGKRSVDSGWVSETDYTGVSYSLGLGGAAADNQMIFLRDDNGRAGWGANASTVTHEFGHNYSISTKNFSGTAHTEDVMPTEGFWVSKKLNKSSTEGNSEAAVQKSLMSVTIQPENERWICDYDYDELFTNVPSTLIRKAPTAGNHLFIAGGYDLSDRFYLSPVWEADYTANAYPAQGDLTLVLFNRSGSQVGTYNFLSSSTMFGEGKTLTVKSFAFFVPSPTDLGSIQIRRGSTILKEIKRSAHAPTVSITSPANGVTWTGTQTLSWSGADQDQEKVLYTVRYSNDGGTTWQSLAANYDRTSLSINSAQLPSGRTCLLRVSATDGTLNFTSKDVTLSVDNGMAIGLLSPSNAGMNVPVGSSIEASLMTPVAETQVTPSTLTLKETYTNAPVAGTLTYSAASKTLVFVPASNMQYSTRYTATVKSGLTDDFGIRLSSDVEWSFTTIADSSDLSIRSLDPSPSSSNSPVNGGITAVFNKEMNSSTLTPSSFMLYDNTAKSAVTGTVTYTSSSKSAMFTPASPLKALNDYRVTLTTAIKSTDNRSLANNYQFFFITGTDSIAGIHLTGAYSETGIDDNNDRLYDWLAIDVTINVIDAGSYSINGKLADKDDNEIVWASSNNLYLNKGLTTVRLKFDGRVINAYRINGPYYLNDLQVYNTSNTNKSEWTSYAYTTKTYQYTEFQTSTIPVVTTFTPADGAIDVPANSAVTATFTRSMNPVSIDSMSFYVVDRANVKVRGTIAYDTTSHQAQFTPSAAFHADSVYRVAMTTGIRDVSGTRLLKQYNWSFTIASSTSTASGSISDLYTYPNPFPHSSLPQGGMYFTYLLDAGGGRVKIRIYTITGDFVKEIAENRTSASKGFNQVYWNGMNEAGRTLANGTYIYIIHYTDGSGSEHRESGKFTVLKGE